MWRTVSVVTFSLWAFEYSYAQFYILIQCLRRITSHPLHKSRIRQLLSQLSGEYLFAAKGTRIAAIIAVESSRTVIWTVIHSFVDYSYPIEVLLRDKSIWYLFEKLIWFVLWIMIISKTICSKSVSQFCHICLSV